MFPNNGYKNFIQDKLKELNLNNIKNFVYNPNLKFLPVKSKPLINYSQRKKI